MRASASNTKHPTRSLLPMITEHPLGERPWRFYELAGDCEEACLIEIGTSDIGRPIHAFIMTRAGMTSEDLVGVRTIRKGDKLGLLINNAIHPGEPCGVDASVAGFGSCWPMTKRDVQPRGDGHCRHPHVQRGWCVEPQLLHANEPDGPEEYGFRGNARNLDLNRDFIKMDSRNAEAFADLFHAFSPDIFIDTHTTNGADYPYEMTLIATQPDKAGPVLGAFIRETMEPALYASMEQRGVPTSPYVYSSGDTPEEGIVGFLETPRYSTGYAALFGCIGFTAEAHMLKPFPVRVQATKALIESTVQFMAERSEELKAIRSAEAARWENMATVPVRWKRTEQFTTLWFEGFESRKEISPVTGELRLKYDRSKRWSKEIPFYNHYAPVAETEVPEYWVIPQAWRHVVARMQRNGVAMTPIEKTRRSPARRGHPRIYIFTASL